MVPLIRDNLAAITELCRAHRVKQLFLVGSALGESFDPEHSDVDFLVVFEEFERSGWDDPYFKLLAALEALLKRPVDLIEGHTVRNPVVRRSMERSKVPIYAAA